MIDGRQLSIGAFPVWNALLDSTVACAFLIATALVIYVSENKW
jgi:hypothetical protein